MPLQTWWHTIHPRVPFTWLISTFYRRDQEHSCRVLPEAPGMYSRLASVYESASTTSYLAQCSPVSDFLEAIAGSGKTVRGRPERCCCRSTSSIKRKRKGLHAYDCSGANQNRPPVAGRKFRGRTDTVLCYRRTHGSLSCCSKH